MLFVFSLAHMLKMKGSTQLGFVKKHGPCAHDAHITSLFPASIPLPGLATHFLLLAHPCSLITVRRLILAAIFLFLAA